MPIAVKAHVPDYHWFEFQEPVAIAALRMWSKYRVITKEVSFGISGIILADQSKKISMMKGKDRVLSLSKF